MAKVEVKNLKNENTIIVITKNKNILKDEVVNQIILLDNNKVIGIGLYDDLKDDNKKIFNNM